jgi:hypothetical protein
VTYSRALFDLRRYNRLGPNAQLNLRAVFGGWVNGDALPVQRRFAVSGIDALPGFDFRRMLGTTMWAPAPPATKRSTKPSAGPRSANAWRWCRWSGRVTSA